MKVVIIMGSEKDASHALKITKKLDQLNIKNQTIASSAHKKTKEVLSLLSDLEGENRVVLVTIAGRSNALSGVCAANSRHPVIACPPFADKLDMLVNIQSTLQMPSDVPVLTILDPENCAIAAKRIIEMGINELEER